MTILSCWFFVDSCVDSCVDLQINTQIIIDYCVDSRVDSRVEFCVDFLWPLQIEQKHVLIHKSTPKSMLILVLIRALIFKCVDLPCWFVRWLSVDYCVDSCCLLFDFFFSRFFCFFYICFWFVEDFAILECGCWLRLRMRLRFWIWIYQYKKVNI